MGFARKWLRLGVLLASATMAWTVTALPSSADSSHLVAPGETLSGIADAYGIPLGVLAAQNHIVNVDVIFAGQQLVVPTQAPPVGPPLPSEVSQAGIYRVQPGDNLWSIASMQRTTIQRLIAANPDIVNPNHIIVDQAIRLPGGTGGATSATPQAAPSSDVRGLLSHYAGVYGIDPALVQALAWQESGWRQEVVSVAGAQGVMQIMPDTGVWLAQDIVGQPLDVAGSTEDNILAGVAFLRYLIDRTGSTEMAVAAYYQGPGSLQQYGMFPETKRYVANVMAIRSYIMVYGSPPMP